jgi:hypothetical protein
MTGGWAGSTATSRNGERAIVVRFVDQLPNGFSRATQPRFLFACTEIDGEPTREFVVATIGAQPGHLADVRESVRRALALLEGRR